MAELGAASAEIRQLEPLDPDLPTRTDKVTFWLDLPSDSKAMWESLKTKVRTKIRKAQRQNFQIVHGKAELLEDFFWIYIRGMRDLGSPSHSRRFFRLILETYPESSRIFVVRNDGRAVAAALTLSDRLAFRVPWSASDPEARRAGANRLLFWSMLAFAADAGAPRFDFGRSGRDSGTHEFKNEWKPETVPLHWHYLLAEGTEMPELSMDNPRYRLFIGAWKWLPVPLAARLGPRVVAKLA
jgi:FemAB-related protein (PEP-CTERM system-associated)